MSLKGKSSCRRTTVCAGCLGLAIISTVLAAFGWKEFEIIRAVRNIEGLDGSIDVPHEFLLGPQQVFFDIEGRKAILNDDTFQALLPHLLNLPRLRHLDLCGTQLSADGLEGIGVLTTLTKLDLPARCLTENSIREIATLKRLESLSICGELSADAMDRLQRALPATRIRSRNW